MLVVRGCYFRLRWTMLGRHLRRCLSTSRNTISSEKTTGYGAVLEKAAQILHNLSYEDQRASILFLHAAGANSGELLPC